MRVVEEYLDGLKKENAVLQQQLISSKKELKNATTPRGSGVSAVPQSSSLNAQRSSDVSNSGVLNRKHQEIKELKKRLAELEAENKKLQGGK